MTPTQFVKTYYPLAEAVTRGTRVLPTTVLTVAALETAWGESELAKNAYNFFGIKHFGTYPKKYGDFRAYDSVQESFKDFMVFLYTNSRYKPVFEQKDGLLQLFALAQAGYNGTSPQNIAEYKNLAGNVYRDYIKSRVETIKKEQNSSAQQTGTKFAGIGLFGGLLLLGAAYGLYKNKN